MRYLSGDEYEEALQKLEYTAKIAQNASCTRSRCGAIIISGGELIGAGVNTPPQNLESQRRCACDKTSYHKKVTDKTCCIHAEQRAIMNALAHNPDLLPGSRLYFTRIDDEHNIKRSGKPYCTICSKMTLDAGIAEFVLFHEDGICVYDVEEYNDLSFRYSE